LASSVNLMVAVTATSIVKCALFVELAAGIAAREGPAARICLNRAASPV